MLIDRNPDHWKLFFIYYNPDDPRVFARKRTGLGYTFNFARPQVWLAGLLFAIVAVACGILSHRLPH